MEAIRRGLAVWATGRWHRTSWLHAFISTITRKDARRKAHSSPRLYPQLELSLTQATSRLGWSVELPVSARWAETSLGALTWSTSPGTRWCSRCSAAICLLTGERGRVEDWFPWPSPRLCSEYSRLPQLGFMPGEHYTCALVPRCQNGSFSRLQTNNWKARVGELKVEFARWNIQRVIMYRHAIGVPSKRGRSSSSPHGLTLFRGCHSFPANHCFTTFPYCKPIYIFSFGDCKRNTSPF